MANFGELVLVLGDLHIPHRASKIPPEFQRMLVPNKMQHVICTGNLSPAQYEDLQRLAPKLHIVAGDYDDHESVDGSLVFPESRVVQIGIFRIGIIHGHQILPWKSPEAIARMRRKLNVDILITGHTHQNEVTLQDGSFYHINPGSITGAYSSLLDGETTPSFILLAVQETKIVSYVYELVNDEVKVSKTEISKKTAETTNPALLQSLLT